MRKLPKFASKLIKTSQKGFTLIELLVVIGILGILISAMVATIDPFEQINKGNDANMKNISAEFVNGNIRYYTTNLKFPWDDAGANCDSAAGNPSAVALNTWKDTCIDTLVDDGELKEGFKTVAGLDKLFITSSGTSIRACFQPISKSGQRDASTKYSDNIGTLAGADTCKSDPPGATNCYWCTE